jgi:hypothetical protein
MLEEANESTYDVSINGKNSMTNPLTKIIGIVNTIGLNGSNVVGIPYHGIKGHQRKQIQKLTNVANKVLFPNQLIYDLETDKEQKFELTKILNKDKNKLAILADVMRKYNNIIERSRKEVDKYLKAYIKIAHAHLIKKLIKSHDYYCDVILQITEGKTSIQLNLLKENNIMLPKMYCFVNTTKNETDYLCSGVNGGSDVSIRMDSVIAFLPKYKNMIDQNYNTFSSVQTVYQLNPVDVIL